MANITEEGLEMGKIGISYDDRTETMKFKVGQVWADDWGTQETIVSIDNTLYEGRPILTNQAVYTVEGKWCVDGSDSEVDLVTLISEPEGDDKAMKFKEQVNNPSHYGSGKDDLYEVIKVIDAWELGFSLGNCIKYIGRAGKKDNVIQDLSKARWYLDHEINKLKGE